MVNCEGDAVHLAGSPLFGVSLERDAASARVDILTGDDCGGHLIEPALRIGPAVEVARVLPARLVAIAGPVAAIGTLADARHLAASLPNTLRRPQVARLACCCNPPANC
jgi:hypothetical protein